MARDIEKERAYRRARTRKARIAKYGPEAADQDMRGRHGNNARGLNRELKHKRQPHFGYSCRCGGTKTFYAKCCAACKGLTSHGWSQTVEYRIWNGMRKRCTDPTNRAWPDYGGRGITICARWLASPGAFIDDVGQRPSPRHEIDRPNNDGGYWCGHCEECVALGRTANWRWTTRRVNCRNRRSNRLVTFDGEQHVITALAELFGLRSSLLRDRLARGWDLEMALTQPLCAKGHQQRSTRLSDAEVRELRRRLESGEELGATAQRFGISEKLVDLVVHRKVYQDVA